MDVFTLISISLLVGAVAMILLAWPLMQQWRQRRAAARTIDEALVRQATQRAAGAAAQAGATQAGAAPATQPAQQMSPRAAAVAAATAAAATQGASPALGVADTRRGSIGAQLGGRFSERFNQHWLESRLGKAAVSAEEQQLLEQCGFYGVRPRAVFGALRLLIPGILAALAFAWKLDVSLASALAWAFAAFAGGFLLAKTLLRRRAAQRLRSVADELPILIDMLRLLQGVGLSIDQSLQIIVTEFGSMLQVLGPELQRSNQQFASGRSREQTLLRIGKLFDDEDLKGLITLLTQVDRHGGAVQEPLRQFGERLQIARKARMKDKIGRLTVKMTGVMVVSLLPVLLILTAGPGFLGVMRMLAQMNGGS
ncbi:tight adherence protein C [Cupriavidus metallidurans]|jgi:tight adherence protein C|uniref:type II secretion system F family protein n=1 Tax=Cupriavidus TaxID=106589 RepID=UPI000492EBE6|nr:type II secretion system F family protein [Cupriavidus metallidurans]AVA35490.1 type II secretion system F family protein [Cupriavidus metallidurans]KWW35299.1 hypothetical protein AU374_03366 [Cupriavidus metallidurans]MDE4921444.1 type II secretion system F family protein [Cupriavidus metallidurans]